MKFGDWRNQAPKIGQKVYLKPITGSSYIGSSLHEIMKKYGFVQAERKNDFVWRTKYQLPDRSWRIMRDKLVDQADIRIDRVE